MVTICRACGNPLELAEPVTATPIEQEIAVSMLGQILPYVVHDDCFDRWQGRAKRVDEANVLAKRNGDWRSLCPALYQDTIPARIPNQGALQKVLDWQFGPKGLVLHGETARGKTRSVWLMLQREHLAGRFIAATTHTDFAARATLAAYRGEQSAVRWVKMLSQADILFVDDLGKSRFKTADGSSRSAEETLFAILEQRWMSKRPCIFTTNGSADQFERNMSQDMAAPFVRRLREFQAAIHF